MIGPNQHTKRNPHSSQRLKDYEGFFVCLSKYMGSVPTDEGTEGEDKGTGEEVRS